MTYGSLCALCWGISTLLAAVAARRIGALRTVVLGEAAALVSYLLVFIFGHFSLNGVGDSAWLLILAGLIGVAGYLALYRGLESGHVRPGRSGRAGLGDRGRLERVPAHPARRRAAVLP